MEAVLRSLAGMGVSELNLVGLGLTELPPIEPTLRALICYDNAITELPPLVFECPSELRRLDCSNNALTYLPPLPPTLEVLDCGNNMITELPPLPPMLRNLCCKNNPIAYPPPEVLKNDIPFIRKWMEENPRDFVKSALKD